jgi:hypothetical protein
VLVGVPKAGTTSLHHYLGQHPEVYVSPMDEVNFLSYPGPETARTRYSTMSFRVTSLEAYEALYAPAAGRVAVDFSASCFTSEVAVPRIKAYLHDPHLLVLLRDPSERAYSAYLHRVRKGYERRSPDEALVAGENAVELGFYADRIAELQKEFGLDRLRVWLLDDLRADPEATLADVLSYLGVNQTYQFDTASVLNRGSAPKSQVLQHALPRHQARRAITRAVPGSLLRPARWLWERTQRPADPLPTAVATRLRALYAGDIRRLEGLIQRDLSRWIEPQPPRMSTG